MDHYIPPPSRNADLGYPPGTTGRNVDEAFEGEHDRFYEWGWKGDGMQEARGEEEDRAIDRTERRRKRDEQA